MAARSGEESSESDGETEPASYFQRRISTNREIISAKCIKEGFLLKQTSSLQRWKRRYFKLNNGKLYYSKSNKSIMFNEVQLLDSCIAECNSKSMHHTFQVITPFRNFVLSAKSRKEMEEWIAAIRSSSAKDCMEVGNTDMEELSAGEHQWCSFPQVRPLHCNVCTEPLSSSNTVIRTDATHNNAGLSCEVCRLKVHKRCAIKVSTPCKWRTMASMGDEVIEDDNGMIIMPHQWVLGNLPVNSRCSICDKSCGSIRRLQDWTCLWCHCIVHNSCRESLSRECSLGLARLSCLAPIAISSLDSDGFWRASKLPGTSPLLVFINSRSGDNQGVKMIRKFRQLLNPAQVFDLMNGGPNLGLRLFQHFESFRVLVCGGDGSIGWVLNEIDKLGLHRQCQVGVLPLGTGNDLARVLGWGALFDDETQLPSVVEQLEHAQIRMLDRWSIHTYESSLLSQRCLSSSSDPMSAFEDSASSHLSRILYSDSHNVVISSAMVLCSIVKELVDKVGQDKMADVADVAIETNDGSIYGKCDVLRSKLDALMNTLNEESRAISNHSAADRSQSVSPEHLDKIGSADISAKLNHKEEVVLYADETTSPVSPTSEKRLTDHSVLDVIIDSPPGSLNYGQHDNHRKSGSTMRAQPRIKYPTVFRPKEQLMLRANSLKKAIRQIIQHTERAIDEQNGQTLQFEEENAAQAAAVRLKNGSNLAAVSKLGNVTNYLQDGSSCAGTAPPIHVVVTDVIVSEDDIEIHESPATESSSGISRPATLLTTSSSSGAGYLSVPRGLSPCLSEEGESSLYSTPGVLTPYQSPVMCRSAPKSPDLRLKSPSLSPMHWGNRLGVGGSSGFGGASRRISNLSAFNQSNYYGLAVERDKSPYKETSAAFPLLHQSISCSSQLSTAGLVSGSTAGRASRQSCGFISQLLLANADAMCAAATPLVGQEEVSLEELQEKCVMNNYFGIGLDAKIALDFHNKREEHPEKWRSRTKNLMWYGVLGGKEIVQRTYKNLEQRVRLECDGRLIPLPNLQGIVVLNIPSYMGGTNFWGSFKEHDNFIPASFDDRILEVLAVFSSVQLGLSRVINLQRHRIAQCRSVKITIVGEEGVPVQVDGEAWVQPSGVIYITHKNRAQMLTRDKVFEEAVKNWVEKQTLERPVPLRCHSLLNDDEILVLRSFVESTENLIKSVKLASLCNPEMEQDLSHLIAQSNAFLDRLLNNGQLKKTIERTRVSDLVSSVQSLYIVTKRSTAHKTERTEVEDKLLSRLSSMREEMKNIRVIGGLPLFNTEDEEEISREAAAIHSSAGSKDRGKSRWKFFRGLKKERPAQEKISTTKPNAYMVRDWSTEEVSQWLHSLELDEYQDVFAAHDIRGKELLTLGRTDLKELGIKKVGHVKRILQAIKDINVRLKAAVVDSQGNSTS